jgi:hypothetical protein
MQMALNKNRRALLTTAFFGCAALAGCGAGGKAASDAPPPSGDSESQEWQVNPWPFFVVDNQGPFDLASTLPSGVARGGAFGIASGQLPAGVTLSSQGILTSASSAPIGQTTGVVFSYAEPST